MTDKSSKEQLEAIERFNKDIEQFDKYIEQFDKGIERSNKEELVKSIIQTIKEFEEGRMILSSPLKRHKREIRANKLKEEIYNESKKYYNDIEIE